MVTASRFRPVFFLCGVFLAGLAVLWAGNGPAAAQHFNFKTYTTSDGLPQNVVHSLLQDSTGRLWIGTIDGLSCYDGTGFRNFGKENGLTNTRILSIFEDSPTVFHFGTRQGITRIDISGPTPKLTAILGTSDVRLDSVGAITRSKGGTYWFGTADGLALWDGQTLRKFPLPPDRKNVTATLRDSDGTLWFGIGNELLRIESPDANPRVTFFGPADGLLVERVRGLFRDSKGALWVAGHAGLNRGVGSGPGMKFRHFGVSDGFPADNFYLVGEDQQGHFWVSTNQGAAKFTVTGDPATAEVTLSILGIYQEKNGLSDDRVVPVIVDRERNVWFGTHNGLAKLETERFVNFDARDGLPSDLVNAVASDGEGAVWIATDKGLAAAIGTRVVNLTGIHPKLAKGVRCLYRTRDGRMIAACEEFSVLELTRAPGGALTPATVTARELTLQTDFKQTQILALSQSEAGDILVGTLRGILRHDGKRSFFYDSKSGLSGDVVFEFGRNQTGEQWIGTNNGITRITVTADGTPTFTPLSGPEARVGTNVGPTFRDSTGAMWIATEGDGVFRWDGARLQPFTTANGLSNNVVNHILEQPSGTIWISTNKGVDLIRDGKIEHFDDAEGFSRKGTDSRGAATDREGNIWFATQYGAVKYVAAEDRPSAVAPILQIVGARVAGEPATETEFRDFALPTGAAFGYRRNSLEFNFVGVSLAGENRVTYRWKLEGFDADWQPASKLRAATYQNLPPGSYTFVAKAVNADGLESTPVRLRFSIARPFWQRWWFLLLAALAVGGGGFGLHRLRISAIQSQKEELERTVARRTVELGDALRETEQKNTLLEAAKTEVELKNKELDRKIEELEASNRQADRIFSALAQALPGTVLDGKYRLDYKIGTGGFGAVFRGTHVLLNNAIAVKVFRPSVGNDSTNAVERFRREGIATCRVNHPNAVKVMDSGISQDGIAYIVMELLDGHSLAEEIRRRPGLSLARAATIVAQVCDALEAAHAAGIIHRDIKPDNIFLHETPDGEIIKVVDFGIAKLVGGETNEDMETLTKTGGIIGTPVYMSPERLNGHPCDGKSDVYSVGITLYQMLAGRVPFQSTGSSMVSVILGHLNEKPRQLRELRPDIPPEIEAIIHQSIRKRPSERPRAAEFGATFAAAVAALPENVRNFTPPIAAGYELTEMATIAPDQPNAITRMPVTGDFPTWSGDHQRTLAGLTVTGEPEETPTLSAENLPTGEIPPHPTAHS